MDWINGFNALVGDSVAHVGWAQMSLRAIIIFAYGLIITRLGAWRAFGRWSTPDIVVAIIVGANLSRALTAGAPLIATIVATTVFLGAWWLISFAASRSDWLDWLFKGQSMRLITDGSVDRDAMHKAVVSRRDLAEGLREKGVADPDRVVSAFLERNGSITVIREEDLK